MFYLFFINMRVLLGKWCYYYLNLSISYLIIIFFGRYKLKECGESWGKF